MAHSSLHTCFLAAVSLVTIALYANKSIFMQEDVIKSHIGRHSRLSFDNHHLHIWLQKGIEQNNFDDENALILWEATYKVTSQSNSGEADSAEQQFFLKDVCRPQRVAMSPCFDARFFCNKILLTVLNFNGN